MSQSHDGSERVRSGSRRVVRPVQTGVTRSPGRADFDRRPVSEDTPGRSREVVAARDVLRDWVRAQEGAPKELLEQVEQDSEPTQVPRVEPERSAPVRRNRPVPRTLPAPEPEAQDEPEF